MGDHTPSRDAHVKAMRMFVPEKGPATRVAEQQARATNKLNSLVDPSNDVNRRSLIRFTEMPDGTFKVNVGCPIPIASEVDTTGSMGGNVDVAIKVLPDTCEFCARLLPGYDPQYAVNIFGDVQDQFVYCRMQFEMESAKLVEQLTLQVPCRDGGDAPEDPMYGLFAGAYLTAAYINRIDLLGYHFLISDAPGRDKISLTQLERIFGKTVLEAASENGHQINRRDLPSTREIVRDLKKLSHAFFLQVGRSSDTANFWEKMYGEDRVVALPRTELLPAVQAAIIGLTEGTLELAAADEFLRHANVSAENARLIVNSLKNIPIGAQAALPNFARRPRKGDIFASKTDVWPIGSTQGAGQKPSKPGKPADGKPTGNKPGSPTWL